MAAIARNLGVSGRRQRLLMGVAFMAIAVVGAALLVASGLPRGARVALFLPFYVGAVGLWQYRDHT
ncbi:MAG: hypothetical protein DMD78_10640 [Candidatus Rokuibacteriota bacterium]|jgi:hypothetical protein|nr:MAG: hypothetical protein DMD78_10640 [Candidatus Rokubacteria bacterium]